MDLEDMKKIFGEDDPCLKWIQEQLDKGKTLQQIEDDYKAFHILGQMEKEP